MVECKVCGKVCEKSLLINHVILEHKITLENYVENYLLDEVPLYCREAVGKAETYSFRQLFEQMKRRKYDWDLRAEKLAELIVQYDIETVFDLGCGLQGLKRYLPDDVRYFGYDKFKYDDNVIVCDLSTEFPSIDGANNNAVTFLGVLEYFPKHRVKELLQKASSSATYIFGSYYYAADKGEFPYILRKEELRKILKTFGNVEINFMNDAFEGHLLFRIKV